MNTFGEQLRLTTFGESHGEAVGGVIDGFPAGVKVDFKLLERRLAERRPGQRNTSSRRESDIPEFLSGITPEGVTLGTPIAFIIRNKDVRSSDYDLLRETYRPNHADYTWILRFGIRDIRGGGRSSARETVCRVVAGAFAEQLLNERGVKVEAWLESVGAVRGDRNTLMAEVERVRMEKDSVGGVVACVVSGMPGGIGDPVYGKVSARLAAAMMGINAAKGFEIGDGFSLAAMKGSQAIDEFCKDREGKIVTFTNHSGGLQGGITNGMPVTMRVAFKPTPTIGKEIPLLDEAGNTIKTVVPGRHDPCVAVRAVPVVRAMAALVMADLLL